MREAPKAGKASRMRHRNAAITSCFTVGRQVELELCYTVGVRKVLHFRAAGRRERGKEMENWHSAQAAKCLHLCQAQPGSGVILLTGGSLLTETTEGETLDTIGASSSPAPLRPPASSAASSCTISSAEVHLLRKRR